MRASNSNISEIYIAPAIIADFLKLPEQQDNLQQAVNILEEKYPRFFQRLLKISNSEYFNLPETVTSVYQAISLLGIERITQLALIQIIYQTFNQYKISTMDMRAFWQDSLRRAVSARMTGELTGLDANTCFCAGFIQDIGYLLLFLEQPAKAVLWSEFHKREPEARLSMEQNIFNQQHDKQVRKFINSWGVFPELIDVLEQHHNCRKSELTDSDQLLCKVLSCADWLTAVYTADDKSYVLNHCRKLLSEGFQMEPYKAEEFLEKIPDKVELAASVLDIDVNRHIAFAQVLYEANIRLNEDNENFQELTQRLETALDERDKLASEINRDLNLAREIQQSLLPDNRGDNYPLTGINISAKILSGDFYDFFEPGNGDIYFNLGDVSGKGVNAALLMAKTSSLFRCLGKRIDDPAQLMFEVNNELCETSIHGMFVTMVAGRYQSSTGEIQLVNAGNPPALLFSEEGLCREFEATAPPLGIMPDTIYTKYTINLKNGSLYIYSDGVTEGYTGKNEMLELEGLFKLIAGMGKKIPANRRLKNIVDKFTHTPQTLRDDITMLLLEKPSDR